MFGETIFDQRILDEKSIRRLSHPFNYPFKRSVQSVSSATSKCMLMIGLFSFALLANAQAQPVQKQPNVGQLQRQLAQLQTQMASLQNANTKGALHDESRVKSVGSQRITRAPETVETVSLHIRLYDLSDLFAASPSYPAVMPADLVMPTSIFHQYANQSMRMGQGGVGQGGGFGGGGMGGGGGGGVFSLPPTRPFSPQPAPPKKQEAGNLNLRSAQVSMDQLVDTIRETVEPEMWGKNRDAAKVQFLGNTLLITATEDMHSQINNLLNLFRQHWGRRRTVSIQTYWVRASASTAGELLDQETSEDIGAGVVSPEKWKAFVETAKTEKRFAYSATLTGHNNQTLHAISGRQRQLTLDAVPFESTDAKMWFEEMDDVDPFPSEEDDEDMDYFTRTRKVVGFKPIRQSFHDGAVIQVTPLATRGGNFVILDLHAKVNELVEADPGEKKPSIFVKFGDNEQAEVELDHANYVSYRLSTTVRCPKEQVVLAGSMTYDPNEKGDEQPILYLFVKTSVHTITEDESDWTEEKIQEQKKTQSENQKADPKAQPSTK